MIETLVDNEEQSFQLQSDESGPIFSVLCGGIGLYEVRFRLSESEQAAYAARGLAYLSELANHVRRNEQDYRSRMLV